MNGSDPADDGGLFPEPIPANTGRHERAFREAFDAAESQQQLTPADKAMMSVAIAGAAALDRTEQLPAAKGIYPVAQLLGPTREALESLRMSPAIRQTELDSALKDVLDDLATPTSSAPVPHPDDAR